MWLILGLLSAFFILVKCNKAVRYYVKCVAFALGLSTITTALLPVIIFRPKSTENTRLYSHFISPFVKLMGIGFEVRNREILERDINMVVVANHQKFFDVMLVFHLGKYVPLTPVGKREIMYYYIYGIVMWLCGCILIDRKKPTSAIEQLNSTVKERIEKKERIKVFIFPEGTRFDNNKINDFKKGAFHLAIQNKLPIVPMVLSTYRPFMNHKAKQFDSMRIIVKTLEPIPTDQLTVDDVNDLILRTRTVMEKAYQESNAEITDYVKQITGKQC